MPAITVHEFLTFNVRMRRERAARFTAIDGLIAGGRTDDIVMTTPVYV